MRGTLQKKAQVYPATGINRLRSVLPPADGGLPPLEGFPAPFPGRGPRPAADTAAALQHAPHLHSSTDLGDEPNPEAAQRTEPRPASRGNVAAKVPIHAASLGLGECHEEEADKDEQAQTEEEEKKTADEEQGFREMSGVHLECVSHSQAALAE